LIIISVKRLLAIGAGYNIQLVGRDIYVALSGFADTVLLQIGHRASACLSIGSCTRDVSVYVNEEVTAEMNGAKSYIPAFLAGVASVCPATRAVTIQAMVENCILRKDCCFVGLKRNVFNL